MVTGIENPRSTTDTAAISGRFEENAMAILDSAGVRDSRDVLDGKLSFLEAVRAAWPLSDSPTPPSWKMFDAIFQILRGSNSLELAMASYQLLTELDKCYPRIYLKRPDNMEFMPGSCSAGVGELVVDKEAWSPFCIGSKAGRSEGEGMSINSHYVDSLAYLSVHHDNEHIANYAEKLRTSTLSLICNGLISAFQTITKIDVIIWEEVMSVHR